MILEIIIFNKNEAIIAEKSNANQLELIDCFDYGGLSPNKTIISDVCEAVSIPVNVMLRVDTRMDFVVEKNSYPNILSLLAFIRDHTNANGIVFGALDTHKNIDFNLLNLIIQNKGHLKLTFHRAIDVCSNIISAYKKLLNILEIDYVLSSGAKKTAQLGIKTLKTLIKLNANKYHAKIICGSGIDIESLPIILSDMKPYGIHIGQGIRTNNKIDPKKINQIIHIIQQTTQ